MKDYLGIRFDSGHLKKFRSDDVDFSDDACDDVMSGGHLKNKSSDDVK